MNVTVAEEAVVGTESLDLAVGELETEIPNHETARVTSCVASGYCL
jgi:hypothetical protein